MGLYNGHQPSMVVCACACTNLIVTLHHQPLFTYVHCWLCTSLVALLVKMSSKRLHCDLAPKQVSLCAGRHRNITAGHKLDVSETKVHYWKNTYNFMFVCKVTTR